MSSPYHQGFHQGYYDPISEPVQWVWVPVPIRVVSTTATLTPVSSPPTDLYTNHALPETETSTNPAAWPQTAPDLASHPQGNSAMEGLSAGLDLPLEPLEFDFHDGRSEPRGPMGLPDQCSDLLPQAMDFSFSDPWAYPATILVPGQETESLGTATPAGTPSAQPYMAQPYPQLLSCPELDCFDLLLQNVDLPKQNGPHNQHASPNPTIHRFHCSQCPKRCPNQRTLDRHLWSKHPEYAGLNGIKSVKRKCSRSGCEYFGRVDNVQRHERNVHGMQHRGR